MALLLLRSRVSEIDLRSEIANAHSASVVDARKKKKNLDEREKEKRYPRLFLFVLCDRAIKKNGRMRVCERKYNPDGSESDTPFANKFHKIL